MIRALLAAALLVFSATHADAAARQQFRRAHAVAAASVAPPTPGPDQTVTMMATQARVVDLYNGVAGCSDTEDIAVTYTGLAAGTVEIMPANTLVASTTEQWRKADLTAPGGLVLVNLQDATPGTNYGRITTVCGGVTYVTQIDVQANGITLPWEYGASSPIRFGGLPLAQLPGFNNADANTSITSIIDNNGVSQPNAFEIYAGHLVLKCNSGSLTTCPANGGGAYTTGSPAAGVLAANRVGDWTVTLHNSSTNSDWTGTIRWVANRWDAAPTPSWMTNNSGNSQLCLSIIGSTSAIHYGDTVVDEGLKIAPITRSTGSCAMQASGTRTYRSGTNSGNCGTGGSFGPCIPTDESSDGWIRVTCREPMQCLYTNFSLNLASLTASGGLRTLATSFEQIDMRTTSGNAGITVADTNGGTKSVNLVMFKHNRANHIEFTTGATDPFRNRKGIVAYNDVSSTRAQGGTTNGIVVTGCDMRIIGNKITEPNGNGILKAITQCTPGGTYARTAFNWMTGMHYYVNGDHPDQMQSVWDTVVLSSGDYEADLVYGNVLHVGNVRVVDCQYIYNLGVWHSFDTTASTCKSPAALRANIPETSVGVDDYTAAMIGVKAVASGQGMFQSNVGGFGNIRMKQVNVGNFVTTDFQNGSISAFPAPGSVNSYNTIWQPSYISPSTPYVFTPPGAVMQYQGYGAKVKMDMNLVENSISVQSAFIGPAPVAFDAGAGNITGGSPSTYLTDPTNTGGRDWSRLRQIAAAYAPKAAAAIGGNTVGAWSNGKIDILSKKVIDSSVFTSTVGANAPACSALETITIDFTPGAAVAGSTLTVTGAATFTNSPSAYTDYWVIYATVGTGGATTTRAGNPAGYTVQAADLTVTPGASRRDMYHLKVAQNADGYSSCLTGPYQLN